MELEDYIQQLLVKLRKCPMFAVKEDVEVEITLDHLGRVTDSGANKINLKLNLSEQSR